MSGTTPSINQKFVVVVAETLNVTLADVVPSANYVNDLGADSLDLVQLQQNTQQAFNIEIPNADAEKQLTVGDTEAWLQAHSG